MELMTLNSQFQPDKLVENYESLIWTERYLPNGDFELKGTNVSELVNLLPLEIPGVRPPTCVTLRDSSVPMIVEDHVIEKPSGAAAFVTITGRSFETVLERRASVKTALDPTIAGVRSAWMMAATKESDAAYRAMRIVLGDAPRYQGGIQILPMLNPAVSVNDAIPQVDLTLPADYQTPAWSSAVSYTPATTTTPGDIVGVGTTIYQATTLAGNLNKPPASSPTYWTPLFTGLPGTWGVSNVIEIKPADLYSTVIELIATNHRGLKAVRPLPGGATVGIEIFNGADLTNTVVFDARGAEFDDAKYLLSARGSTNVAYVYGSNGSQSVLKTAAAEPAGLDRRVLLLDASSDTTVNSADSRGSRGLIELYKYNATALFDGQISTQVAALYNKVDGYFLGDILKLVGEYGLTQNVRVAEFIRTSDATGEKAYPAFEAVV